MSDILNDGLSELGFDRDSIPLFAQKLGMYIKELQLFNSAYNLVNTSDFEELAIRHIFDSLAAHDIINSLAADIRSEDGICVGDIGSGGGLPGIPLAVVFPQFRFTLVERMDRRCAFLENCAAMLGLQNVAVQKSEAEKIPREIFDIAVFRALKPLDARFAKTLLSLIKKGGYLAAYKAKKTNIENEMNAIRSVIADYTLTEVRVPFMKDAERNIVVVKKISIPQHSA
ncbi:16S rRNA (guanine(527)-N(7))-methyltransferase RsmG [Treponema socranskii]|uniref:16S rRNA (guanine(527)-N(7))-methyltransferase RsmG n=1 Tax=Treponema socranskii TaxID=53419 RepID=UPI0028E62EE0|nr:16S rRNA (guanine(527)-N(7))-methyltransferase RsmG [Treponema socranskii]